MSNLNPVDQQQRAVMVDVLRGFALVGVLLANFTSYTDQMVPYSILQNLYGPIDIFLVNLNTVLIEWKFMSLFSILFGYGFGLILSSLERQGIAPEPFFLRRMGWLFVIGIVHCLFWWGDVLHFYAISGAMLLMFRKESDQTILVSSLLLMFLVPAVYFFLVRDLPETRTELEFNEAYQTLKHGSLSDVFSTNMRSYFKMFILSWSDIHDVLETLGRFLLGYYLLRVRLFDQVNRKRKLFMKMMRYSAAMAIGYFILRYISIYDLDTSMFYWEPLLKLGVLCSTAFYVSAIVLVYIDHEQNICFRWLRALGRMTLTNYLLISVFQVVLLYGIGFGQLGELSMTSIWKLALVWLAVSVLFSNWWLTRYRFGPMEWIWRQLTYQKRIPLAR